MTAKEKELSDEELAKEYAFRQLGKANEYHREACRIDFLAGMQAARDQLADKLMKMDTENSRLRQELETMRSFVGLK